MQYPRHIMSSLAWRAVVVAIIVFVAVPAWAQSSRVVSIEEHWSLQIGEPDQDRSSPQASMVMSPTGHLDGTYFLFTLNHESVPDYQPGGVQVQLWEGDAVVDHGESLAGDTLAVDNEHIEWVQRLEIDNGTLTFQIVNGTSQTWGTFGGNDELKLVAPTSLTELNSYLPAISLNESEVSYAGNRVVALVLQKLAWVTEDGQVHELYAPIDIDTDIDP